MLLEILSPEFSICQVSTLSNLPDGTIFLARTDNEISLVCETDRISFNAARRDEGWRCFRVAGELDFSLIGILSRITAVLAEAGISVFCTSTYETDYIMVKTAKLYAAIEALNKAGYETKYL